MFNVTVLKMKDIMKCLIGITLTGLVVVFISKGVINTDEEVNDNGKNVIQKIEKKMSFFKENSMLQALDTTMPIISNINKEYKNVAKEDDENEDKNVLQAILGMQISSINGMEEIEKSKTIEEAKNSQEENIQNEQTEDSKETETQTIAEAGVQTEVITPNPISDGANVQIRKCKNKKSNRLSNNGGYV